MDVTDSSVTSSLSRSADGLSYTSSGKYFRRLKRRFIRSPGAIAILLLALIMLASFSTLEAVLFFRLVSRSDSPNSTSCLSTKNNIITAFVSHFNFIFFVPFWLAGLVADTCVGRYRAALFSVVTSLFVLLVSSVVAAAALRTDNCNALWAAISLTVVSLVTTIPFYANAVQLGTDQLQDASSEVLSSFVHWYVWTYLVGSLPLAFMHLSVRASRDSGGASDQGLLVLPLCVAVAVLLLGVLVLLYLTNRLPLCFVHNPPTAQPYKDIWGVVSFARKNAVPLRRSALTYWEVDIPSRIDLCKEKYGGPYSGEKVEEVKSVLYVLPVLFCMGLACFLYVSALPSEPFLLHLGKPQAMNYTTSPSDPMYSVTLAVSLSAIYGVILIPLEELLFYPCFGNRLKMHTKFRLGIFLYIISIIINLVIDAVGHFKSPDNVPCMFVAYYNYTEGMHHHTEGTLVYALSSITPWVLVVPGALSIIATTILFVAGVEFAIAQTPQAMKGVLIGFAYGIVGVFVLLGVTFTFAFQWTPSYYYSCCSLYYTINSIFGFLVLGTFSVIIGRYKMRLKNDVVHEYRIIEEYYNKVSM